MDIKNKIEEILLTDYQYVDCYTVDKLLDLFAVSGQSEQFVCGANRVMGKKRCERQCGQCEELYPQTNCY